MTSAKVRQYRARTTDDQHRALLVRAAELGLDRVTLVTRALETAPVTRDIFKRGENSR